VILKIAHIGVAVKNVEEVEKLYSEVLGLTITGREVSPDNKVSFIPLGTSKREERGSTISPWKWTTSKKPSKK